MPIQGKEYLDLIDQLEKDLRDTGFDAGKDPPGSEPRVPSGMGLMTKEELKGLYDRFLSFYDYISHAIVTDIGKQRVAKARLEAVEATAFMKTANRKDLGNAELRRASVEMDPEYVGANKDYVFIKARLMMNQTRVDVYKRAMDRLGKELWYRSQDDDTRSHFGESATKGPKNRPRRITR